MNALGKRKAQKEAHPVLSNQNAVKVHFLLDHSAPLFRILRSNPNLTAHIQADENTVLLQQRIWKGREGRLLCVNG